MKYRKIQGKCWKINLKIAQHWTELLWKKRMEASYIKPEDEPISRSYKESNPQWLPLLKNSLKRKETNILLNDHEQNRTKAVIRWF